MAEPALQQPYDDDDSEEAVTRPNLHAIEGGGETTEPRRGHLRSVGSDETPQEATGGSSTDNNSTASPEELSEAEQSGGRLDRFRQRRKKAKEAGSKGEGSAGAGPQEESLLDLAGGIGRFYNKEKDKPRWWQIRTPAGKFNRRGKMALGVGGSIIGLTLFGVTLFNFLNVFKLDHILQNIDAKVMSRYNAQFNGRSKSYVQAYIRIRMLEFGDKATPDPDGNLYFRANKVSTGNSFKDWYNTIRTSNFEKDLREKDGITFTSVLTADGKLRAGKLTIKGEPIPFNVVNKYSAQWNYILDHPKDSAAISTFASQLGKDFDFFFEKQVYESDKAARKAFATTIDTHYVHWWQANLRRRVRKDIQNEIGVRDWTFFEKTVSKLREKKTNIQQKFFAKLFPDNNDLSNLLQCIFIGTNCRSNNDPENKVATGETVDPTLDQQSAQATDANGNPKVDKNGNPVTETVGIGGSELASDAQNAFATTTTEDLSKTATKDESSTISQRIVNQVISKFVGEETGDVISSSAGDVTKWWQIAKRVAKFQQAIKNHTFSKIIKRARMARVIAASTIYFIARDQAKTGQLTSQEYGDLLKTLDNFNNSEGWQNYVSGAVPGAAAAAAGQSAAKKAYCSAGHIKLLSEFQWFCDDQKPNSGGSAQALEDSWNNSVGYITAPIAAAVDTVTSIPVVGALINTFTGLVSKVTGAITNLTIEPALKAFGIESDMGKLMSFVFQKVLAFFGVFQDMQPGLANFLIAGRAGTAENATREAGGVASTPSTLNYSNQYAAAFEKDQRSQQSIFDRYASLNNPDSLAAKSLFSVANLNLPSFVSSLSNVFGSAFSAIGNVFSGRIFAATANPASATAQWAGVDTYDIPQQCQNLDPLDPNYLQDAVGVQADSPFAGQAQGVLNAIRGSITSDNVRDEAAFWKLVYDKIGANNNDGESIAGAIYNCALLDRQVEGGVGYLYGYTDDDGLNSGSQTSSGNTSTSTIAGSDYQNPFRDVPDLTPERIDQGVDFAGTGPVYAIGTGTVIDATHNSGWPGGNWVSYQLQGGPADGKVVFVAEDCNVTVRPTQTVTPNTVICNMFRGSTGIEIGWAEPGLGEHAMAHTVWNNGVDDLQHYTAYGKNFSDFLVQLHAPAGTIKPGAQELGSIPTDWPTW